MWGTTAASVVGHSLLATGVVLLLLLFIFICIRPSINHRQAKASVPLPTPPVCRRQNSVHTVYPPTPPITRQQQLIYTICRPTAPDGPFISVGAPGKSSSPAPSFLCSSRTRRSLWPDIVPPSRPHRSLVNKSPMMSEIIPSVASLPGSKPLHRTISMPGFPQVSFTDT